MKNIRIVLDLILSNGRLKMEYPDNYKDGSVYLKVSEIQDVFEFLEDLQFCLRRDSRFFKTFNILKSKDEDVNTFCFEDSKLKYCVTEYTWKIEKKYAFGKNSIE